MSRALLRKTLWIAALTIAALFAILRWPLQLGLDLRGGASLILRVKLDVASAEQRQGVMEQTRQILERRINAYGLSEARVQPYGNRGNELLVQLPGVSEDRQTPKHAAEGVKASCGASCWNGQKQTEMQSQNREAAGFRTVEVRRPEQPDVSEFPAAVRLRHSRIRRLVLLGTSARFQ